jgi:hypothetical protein
MSPEAGSRLRFFNLSKTLKRCFSWVIPGLGLVLFVLLAISPRFSESLFFMFENAVRAEAQVQSCEMVRNGRLREHAIRCAFRYEFQIPASCLH